MAAKGYTTIALPNSLVEEVDKVVKKKTLGYTSRPELIKDAIREKLSNLK